MFIGGVFIFIIPESLKSQHYLDSTTVRSSVFRKTNGLLGTKGAEVGSGFVYQWKEDKWECLNEGKPLSLEVEDVQAVEIVNKTTYLAGTWKNGLFITKNAGETWQKLKDFPSNDIRCIQRANKTKLIYAATTDYGIMKSFDNGYTWEACIEDSTRVNLASWSIEIDPKNDSTIYAMTFGRKIKKSMDQGKTWNDVLVKEGVMFYDLYISKTNSKLLWVAGAREKGGILCHSSDGGKTWSEFSGTPEMNINEVLVIEPQNELFIGSWDQGVYKYSNEKWNFVDEVEHNVITDMLIDSNGKVTVFTWGNGIFHLN